MSEIKIGIELFNAAKYEDAFIKLFPIAKEGNSEAQSIIANIYHFGLGRDKDILMAIEWYEKSASQNHVIALNNLAGILIEGDQLVPKNVERAFSLYLRAAKQGFAPAQYIVGTMYLSGNIVSQDKLQAIYWLNLSANNDFEPSKDKIKQLISNQEN